MRDSTLFSPFAFKMEAYRIPAVLSSYGVVGQGLGFPTAGGGTRLGLRVMLVFDVVSVIIYLGPQLVRTAQHGHPDADVGRDSTPPAKSVQCRPP